MKLLKRIAAVATIVAISANTLTFSAFAENVNYYQNWTSDKGNGPANGTSTGNQGTTTFKSNINTGTGTFDVSWNTTAKGSGFNNLAGVGWSTGKANRKIGYNLGIFQHTSGSEGCTYLDFYGWTRNSLIEYYVFENWVNYVPNDGTYVGTLNTDGADYKYYYKSANGPNIDGSGPFKQVISVRDSNKKRTSGTITFQNHVNAWNSNPNTRLGSTWSYQSLGAEGYNSSGKANGSVWEIQ